MKCIDVENIAKLYNIITNSKKIPLISDSYYVKNTSDVLNIVINGEFYNEKNININKFDCVKLSKKTSINISIYSTLGELDISMELEHNIYKNRRRIIDIHIHDDIPICGNPSNNINPPNRKYVVMKIRGYYINDQFINIINSTTKNIILLFIIGSCGV